MTSEAVIEKIVQIMSGSEWSAQTLDDIAHVLFSAGYEIEEPCNEN